MTDKPIDDGGPAFPRERSGSYAAQTGMSLRDWFAGQALAGLSANPKWALLSVEETAKIAYESADAMIAARSAKK